MKLKKITAMVAAFATAAGLGGGSRFQRQRSNRD